MRAGGGVRTTRGPISAKSFSMDSSCAHARANRRDGVSKGGKARGRCRGDDLESGRVISKRGGRGPAT